MSPGRSRSRSRSRSTPDNPYESFRIHISDISSGCSKQEIEKAFKSYGHVIEVWVARKPPCFAFVVFSRHNDAEKAIQAMDGQCLAGSRIRVSWARPRAKGMPMLLQPKRRSSHHDDLLRCYQCGGIGHFSKNCTEVWHFKKGYVRSSHSPSTNESRSRSRSRSRQKNRRSRSRSAGHRRSSHKSAHRRSRSPRHRDRRRDSSPVRSSHRQKQQASSSRPS